MDAGGRLPHAAFAVGAPSKSTITKVSSTNVEGGVEIAIKGESLPEPKTFFASGHSLFIVQFDAALVPEPGRIQVNTAGVGYVRYVRFQAKPPVSRLVLSVGKNVTPVVTQEDGTWFVRVGVATKVAEQKDLDDDSAAMQSAIGQLGSNGASVGTQGKFIGCFRACGATFRFILEVEDSNGSKSEARRELFTPGCVN